MDCQVIALDIYYYTGADHIFFRIVKVAKRKLWLDVSFDVLSD